MHKFETHIISSIAEFRRLQKYESLVDKFPVVIDVETDSAHDKKANLYGIGMCFTDQKAFYIPWRDSTGAFIWSESVMTEIIAWFSRVCMDREIIGHNVIYDVLVIENTIGLDLSQHIYSDTILQKHTLDEERPFALKDVAV